MYKVKNNKNIFKILFDQTNIFESNIHTTFKVYNDNNSSISFIVVLIKLPKSWITKLITKVTTLCLFRQVDL